eukprot:Nitzschia sp. Nitz4//scaffold133_size116822//8420//11773//NITZ4_003791-RA/size116822-processed-gene-0.48-mRNA-1//-1//CDS//3329535348//4892//frame0
MEPSPTGGIMDGGTHERQTSLSGLGSCFGQGRWYTISTYCYRILDSRVWKVVIFLFTIILLFGSPVQSLFAPKSADAYFEILYIVVLVGFVVDMIMHMVVDPDYFGFDPCHRRSVQPFDQARFCTYGIGSFNMWCDVVSTAALCYDISIIAESQYKTEELYIPLNEYGTPNFSEVNPTYPVEFDNFEALVLVCKVARVARLIPATKVVEISHRIHFYWYVQRLNPLWYWARFLDCRAQAAKRQEDAKTTTGGRGIQSKKMNWGGLEMAALAKVKAMADERRKMEENSGFASRILGRLKRVLRRAGVLPATNVELQRHLAATKIQRAWRARLFRPMENKSMDGMDVISTDDDGWRGRAGGSNALERVLKKRNMLGQYHRQNNRNIRNDSTHPGTDGMQQHASTRADSQVGTAMAEVTGQWVATIVLFGLVLTILFTYHERDSTRPSTMAVLHGQVTRVDDETFVEKAFNTSLQVIAGIIEYRVFDANATTTPTYTFYNEVHGQNDLRNREKLEIVVQDDWGRTVGIFANRNEEKLEALLEMLITIFVLIVWYLGVTAFAGPVMTLVITPIERMVRLLGMLMVDPLGYQTNSRFKKFQFEEENLVKNTMWTKEVLKGMETSFLMSTILRIGSLMKVGFGSAGVEIIRHNLQQGQNQDTLILNSQGSTVSCVFLFCDIRQFTDATECLQEEVFVFTNRIAGVVHSICHSYGGSANKNVGDAFLVSWLLEDDSGGGMRFNSSRGNQALVAKHNQADKALLSVVKICMALHFDDYYVQTMTDYARNALLNKLKNRPGPVVQMGFGLHAGKAVQGAIGSQRKIDATYVSEAVERAEYLESSTKQYGLKMLMSDTFRRLLHSSNRRRCRKIDQIMFVNDDAGDEMGFDTGDVMELYTFDMDIDALWRNRKVSRMGESIDVSGHGSMDLLRTSMSRPNTTPKRARRKSLLGYANKRESGSDELSRSSSGTPANEHGPTMVAAAKAATEFAGSMYLDVDMNEELDEPEELVLPSGPALYNPNVWLQEDMRRIRHQYTSVVFETFNSALTRYYEKDWQGARQLFESILERFDDGPSKYFLKQMEKNNGVPPSDFLGYGRA